MGLRTVVEADDRRRISRDYDASGRLVQIRIDPVTRGPTADLPPVVRVVAPARERRGRQPAHPARPAPTPASASPEPTPAPSPPIVAEAPSEATASSMETRSPAPRVRLPFPRFAPRVGRRESPPQVNAAAIQDTPEPAAATPALDAPPDAPRAERKGLMGRAPWRRKKGDAAEAPPAPLDESPAPAASAQPEAAPDAAPEPRPSPPPAVAPEPAMQPTSPSRGGRRIRSKALKALESETPPEPPVAEEALAAPSTPEPPRVLTFAVLSSERIALPEPSPPETAADPAMIAPPPTTAAETPAPASAEPTRKRKFPFGRKDARVDPPPPAAAAPPTPELEAAPAAISAPPDAQNVEVPAPQEKTRKFRLPFRAKDKTVAAADSTPPPVTEPQLEAQTADPPADIIAPTKEAPSLGPAKRRIRNPFSKREATPPTSPAQPEPQPRDAPTVGDSAAASPTGVKPRRIQLPFTRGKKTPAATTPAPDLAPSAAPPPPPTTAAVEAPQPMPQPEPEPAPQRYAVPDLDAKVDALLQRGSTQDRERKRAPIATPEFAPIGNEPWRGRLNEVLSGKPK